MSKPPPPRPDARDDALAVVRRLREAGHVAYFAGGCVRDQLMGRAPKDYDVATDAPPNRVRELFTKTDAVGAAFGVILVRQRRSTIEVATFRTDGSYADGRRPTEVTFSTAEEDAKRRDFTINGLFYDPVESKLIDYVGGQRDIEAKLIRAIGDPDTRFEEDHLRLLRAVRFAARFGFDVEEGTDAAVRRHAPRLARISPERVGEELRLMLTPPTRYHAWDRLMDTGLAGTLFRFIRRRADERDFQQPSRYIVEFTVPDESVPLGAALAAAVVEYRAAALPEETDLRFLFDRATVSDTVQALRRSAKLTNEESDQLQGTLEGLAPLLADDPPTVAATKRFLARPTARWSRGLLYAMGAAEYLPRERVRFLEERLAELEKGNYAPAPLVTGDDLTAAGLTPGPVFKRVLDAVYDAQLEGRVGTKEQALEMALRLARG